MSVCCEEYEKLRKLLHGYSLVSKKHSKADYFKIDLVEGALNLRVADPITNTNPEYQQVKFNCCPFCGTKFVEKKPVIDDRTLAERLIDNHARVFKLKLPYKVEKKDIGAIWSCNYELYFKGSHYYFEMYYHHISEEDMTEKEVLKQLKLIGVRSSYSSYTPVEQYIVHSNKCVLVSMQNFKFLTYDQRKVINNIQSSLKERDLTNEELKQLYSMGFETLVYIGDVIKTERYTNKLCFECKWFDGCKYEKHGDFECKSFSNKGDKVKKPDYSKFIDGEIPPHLWKYYD